MKRALLLCLVLLSACQTLPPVSNPRAVWCETNRDMKLPATAVATLSRADKETFAAYRLKGIEWCGWVP